MQKKARIKAWVLLCALFFLPSGLFDQFYAVCLPENLNLTLHPTPIIPSSQHRSSDLWPVGYGHVAVGNGDEILVTSGYQWDGSDNYFPSDIVWGYTPSSSSWKRIPTTGTPPPQLGYACAVEFAGRIFLHGGEGPGYVFNDDLFVYDIAENQWRKEGGGGIGRSAAVCFADKKTKRIHVFGGINWDNGGDSNELRTYDDGTWSSETDATGPSARYQMAATTVGEAVFLHGGWGPTCEGSGEGFCDDFWRLDLTDMKWEIINFEVGAAKPSKRYVHSLSFLSDDALLLVGGVGGSFLKDVWIYRISTNEWKQHEDLPAESLGGGTGLYRHKATSIMNTDGTRSVYVTGGITGWSSPPYHPKDMFEFKLVC